MPARLLRVTVAHAVGERLPPKPPLAVGVAQYEGERVPAEEALLVMLLVNVSLGVKSAVGVALRVAPTGAFSEALGGALALMVRATEAVAHGDAPKVAEDHREDVGLTLGVDVRDAEDVLVAEPGTRSPSLPGTATTKERGPSSELPSVEGASATGAPTAHVEPELETAVNKDTSTSHTPVPVMYAHDVDAVPSG